jgi:pimeloyl-ACP methyl ester carboxylesterase
LTKELYLFSGLGADERVFQRLDFSGYQTIFIKWIVPRDQESIENYAGRLIEQIKTTRPTLIGISFGGLMAVEVAKQIDTEKVILIASAKIKKEIPFYYRWAGLIGFHKLLPTKLLKSSNFLTNWFFGTRSKYEKQLLKQILIDTNPVFLKWALDKTSRWNNCTMIKNVFHIHGTKDRILPFRFVECDLSIKNGGHFMTLNKSEELTKIIRQQI